MDTSMIVENERVGELEAQNSFLKLRIRLYDKALKKLITDNYKHCNDENNNSPNNNNNNTNNKLKNGNKIPSSISRSPLNSNIKHKNDGSESKDDINVSYASPNSKKKIVIDNKAFRTMMKAALTNLSPSDNKGNHHHHHKTSTNHHLDFQTDGSWLEDDGPIPRFSEHQSILINELQTTLLNLKLGFRKREQAFIEKNKQRDYAAVLLHKTENETIEDIKHICESLCASMEMIENDIEESGKTAQDLMKTAIIESQQTLIAAIELQKENENIKQTLNDAIEQIFTIKTDLTSVTAEKMKIAGELNIKMDENVSLLKRIKLLENELNTNADEILILRSNKIQIEEEIASLKASEQSLNAKNNALEKEREKSNIMIYENETRRFQQKKEMDESLATKQEEIQHLLDTILNLRTENETLKMDAQSRGSNEENEKKQMDESSAKKQEEMQHLIDTILKLRTENEALKMNTQPQEDVKELLQHVDELVDNAHRLELENNRMKKDIDILSKENDDAHSIIEQLEDTRIKYEELLNEQASQESILSIQKEISLSLNEKLASLNEEKSKIETDRSLEESLNAKVAENILLENKLLAATAEIEHVRLEQSNLISTYKNEIESVKVEKKNLDSLFISLSNAQQEIDNLKVKNALLSQEIAVANEERIKDKVAIDRLTLEQNRNMLDFAATISALAAIAT